MTFPKFFRTFATRILVATALVALPSASFAQLAINIRIGPPILPVYVQPVCPGDGYIWTPGYWAYGPEGYYWIPGTWVMAPEPGFLWTPPYWGWDGGFYHFHGGYWGPHIGFYGGINYGFGYFGSGFEGGEWRGNHFFYNTRMGNFGGAHVTNVYEHNVTIVNNNYNRVSFNGGNGGVPVRPQPQELQAEREHHIQATQMQQQHFQAAERDRGQLATVNGGRPQVQAARTPQEFTNHVNTLPQQQRVAPGTPGERFHPNAQTGVPQNNQGRQPQGGQPQNRMQPAAPQQQRNQNQPQLQQRQQPQVQQQPRPQPQPQRQQPQVQQQPRPQPQPQLQQRQMEQPRPQPQRQQMQPQPQPQMQRQQPQPQMQRQQPQPQLRPQEQPRPQQNDHPREERPR